MYDLSGRLEGYAQVPSGTNLLVTSRNADHGRETVLDILGDGLAEGGGAVVVTTDYSAETVMEELQERATFASENVAIVDCYSDEEPQIGSFVYTVPSPSAITSIGIGIIECFRRLSEAGVEHCRVGVLSLSTMLTVNDEAEIFKFSHVVSSRLDASGFLGLFVVDPDRVDTHAYRVICEAFDETVEL